MTSRLAESAAGPSPAAYAMAFWARTRPELFDELRSGAQGLSSAEAARRLAVQGPNALDEEPATAAARLLLGQFRSPLVPILVFGGVVSAILQDRLDAAIILFIVLGSGGLGLLQEYRASNAMAQLRSRLTLTAQVLRDGTRCTLPTRELVAGDVVVRQQTAKDRFARALAAISALCQRMRTEPLVDQRRKLSRRLKWHFANFGISGNCLRLKALSTEARRIWKKWLSRRSNKSPVNWATFSRIEKLFPLPRPRIIHSYTGAQAKLYREEPSA